MADPNNPGQFGNRSDTRKQAQRGGEASSGPSRAQRAEGGRHSHGGGRPKKNDDNDNS